MSLGIGSRDEVMIIGICCFTISWFPILLPLLMAWLVFFLRSAATEWVYATSRQIRGLSTTDLTYSAWWWKKVWIEFALIEHGLHLFERNLFEVTLTRGRHAFSLVVARLASTPLLPVSCFTFGGNIQSTEVNPRVAHTSNFGRVQLTVTVNHKLWPFYSGRRHFFWGLQLTSPVVFAALCRSEATHRRVLSPLLQLMTARVNQIDEACRIAHSAKPLIQLRELIPSCFHSFLEMFHRWLFRTFNL